MKYLLPNKQVIDQYDIIYYDLDDNDIIFRVTNIVIQTPILFKDASFWYDNDFCIYAISNKPELIKYVKNMTPAIYNLSNTLQNKKQKQIQKQKQKYFCCYI